MYSFVKPPIKDAKALAAVAKARNENGVHLYFDEPHTKLHVKYRTPLGDWLKTNSENLTWTTVCCAAQDGASFAVRISDGHAYHILEYGVTEDPWKHYEVGYDDPNWFPLTEFSRGKLHKDDYVVFTAHMKYLKATRGLNVEFELNGDVCTQNIKYRDNQDFGTFGSTFRQHNQNFSNVQLLEIHFLYTGITQGLPDFGPKKEYKSFQYADLCDMRAGDTAVIVGKYVGYNSKYRGILIGAATQQADSFNDFASYKDSQNAATFRVQLGFFGDVSISSDKEEQTLPFAFGVDEVVWLLVDNIDILNLEIHSTLKNR